MGSLLTTPRSYLDVGGGQESYPLEIHVKVNYWKALSVVGNFETGGGPPILRASGSEGRE
jgi:hypothetical protein